MYEVPVFVHILSAMTWVGGCLVSITVELHAVRVGTSHGFVPTVTESEWVDDWIFTSTPLFVIATGIAMVIMSDAWAFAPPWVYLALGLSPTEFVMGTREVERMKEASERGVDTPEFGLALKAYRRMAPVAGGMAIIVFLMVFEPGA